MFSDKVGREPTYIDGHGHLFCCHSSTPFTTLSIATTFSCHSILEGAMNFEYDYNFNDGHDSDDDDRAADEQRSRTGRRTRHEQVEILCQLLLIAVPVVLHLSKKLMQLARDDEINGHGDNSHDSRERRRHRPSHRWPDPPPHEQRRVARPSSSERNRRRQRRSSARAVANAHHSDRVQQSPEAARLNATGAGDGAEAAEDLDLDFTIPTDEGDTQRRGGRGALATCTICIETMGCSKFSNPSVACAHEASTCRQCLRRWFATQRSASAQCLHAGCRQRVEVGDAALWFPRRLRAAYVAKMDRALLAAGRVHSLSAITWCSQPTCRSGQLHSGRSRLMLCASCGGGTCAACGDAWHGEAACHDLDPRVAESAGVKKCPGCGIGVQKNGGCDHVRCCCCCVLLEILSVAHLLYDCFVCVNVWRALYLLAFLFRTDCFFHFPLFLSLLACVFRVSADDV